MRRVLKFAMASLALATAAVFAQSQGVTKDEIVIGTHQDLSGPAATIGKPMTNGLVMRVEEANASGGIHGRKLRLVVEETGFDPRKAVTATQKLVNQDQVFAIVAGLGTSQSVAAMPVALRKNVFHLFPNAGTALVYEPVSPYAYAVVAPYFHEMVTIAGRLFKERKAAKPCIMYQDDEFGQEIMRGAEASLKAIGTELAARTTYKRGDTDFSTQMLRLSGEKCDFVILGTIVRETVGAITAARRIGFEPTFYASQAAYSDAIMQLGGPAMNGLYASMRQQAPRMDDSSKEVQAWITKYKARFGEDPAYGSVVGYAAVDIFVRAAMKAGKDLDNQSFMKAMDTLVVPPDIFGNPEFSWSPTKRLGSTEFRLSQIQNGRWRIVKEYADLK
jgi:branched-chain amino acid transport system substrate-binding protein